MQRRESSNSIANTCPRWKWSSAVSGCRELLHVTPSLWISRVEILLTAKPTQVLENRHTANLVPLEREEGGRGGGGKRRRGRRRARRVRRRRRGTEGEGEGGGKF